MVVGADGSCPLPWLEQPLASALQHQRGHALLVQAAAGSGELEFALCLAQALLCERRATPAASACGRCDSCRSVQNRSHADLFVLLPEDLRRASGWLIAGDKADATDADADEGRARRKPSRQIRIDEVRAAIDWTGTTPARGIAKVIVLHPAEAMNMQAASALLKTLEEPPRGVRLILTTHDAALLLPTVRSRCQLLRLPPPASALALQWLQVQGVADAEVLLAGCGGSPQLALAWSQAGIDGRSWTALPGAVRRGQAGALAAWPLPQAIDALQRLCHDAMRIAVGGAPVYFPLEAMPESGPIEALLAWQHELARVARHDGHAWNEGLLLESLVGQGRLAMNSGTAMAVDERARLGTLRR